MGLRVIQYLIFDKLNTYILKTVQVFRENIYSISSLRLRRCF